VLLLYVCMCTQSKCILTLVAANEQCTHCALHVQYSMHVLPIIYKFVSVCQNIHCL